MERRKQGPRTPGPTKDRHSLEEARAAKSKAKAVFSRFGDVNGVGITRVRDGYGVKVNLVSSLPSPIDVPQSIDDVPVVVEVVGKVTKRGRPRAESARSSRRSAAISRSD